MVSFLRNFQIHSPSFWFGFVAGILFWWIVYTLRHYLPRFIAFFRERMQAAREELSLGIENRLRNEMLQLAQRQHIAAPLFSLDEIAIQPRVIAPPPPVVPGTVPPTDDPIRLTIPYLPEWPELAAVYNTPSLPLVEALQGGANLILIGHPGGGKTFALAYLTSLLSRRDPQAGNLANHVPLLLHAANISKISDEETSIDIVIESLSGTVSTLTQQRLSEFLHAVFTSKRVLILLDGFDELSPDDMKQVVDFLDMLFKEFPSIRVVVTASVDTFAGLSSLDMHPVAMAAWSQPEKVKFIDNWRQMWTRFAVVETSTQTIDEAVSEPVNPLLIRNWLLTREEPLLPLGITLQVWAAYAGDMLGPDIPSAIEAHLRRMSSTIPDARAAMEQLAIQMVLSSSFSVTKKDAANWVAEFEQPELIVNIEDVFIEEEQPTTEAKQDQPKIKIERIIPDLTTNGLLISRHDNWIAFLHPVMTGYLAASALAKFGTTQSIQDQPEWLGKSLALSYLAYFGDVSAIVNTLIKRDDILHRDRLKVARWLRYAPRHLPWRGSVLRQLANILQKEYNTIALAGRAMIALALSGDPGVETLFKQLLQSEHPNLRQLATLGIGITRDTKAINDLGELVMVENNPNVSRAACLALIAIGTKDALEEVATALLQGNEITRRSAAEAFANHPEEGYAALEDGSKMEDIMIRRSVVFGLMRINQPWAVQIIERMQMEEEEWIVRTAAIQALEDLQQESPYIPKPIPPLTETPWLIAYAGKLGMGVSPGRPAVELLLQALKDGEEDERLAALDYLRLRGDDIAIRQLFDTYFGSQGEIREASFNTLWHLAASGIELPSPIQFGLS